MEESMEEVEGISAYEEFDVDYEFSAPHFFDFMKEETLLEAQEAEAWFHTGESHPPSPYLSKLHTKEELVEFDETEDEPTHILATEARPTLGTDSSIMEVETQELFQDNRIGDQYDGVPVNCLQNPLHNPFNSNTLEYLVHDCNSNGACKEEELSKGLVYDNKNVQDFHRSTQKSSHNVPQLRSSTLMKPTASHLAKQKVPISRLPKDTKCSSRIIRPESVLTVKHDKNPDISTPCLECQASKRQKLEGGHTREVHQLHDRKQVPLHHKESKRLPVRGNHSSCSGPHDTRHISKSTLSVKNSSEGIHARSNLKLTVPREPELETARRARRRAMTSPDQHENVVLKAPVFRPQPLNKRTSNLSSTANRSSPSDTKPPQNLPTLPSRLKSHGFDATKQLHSEHHDIFRARPLNKKIFPNKANLDVCRNLKQETRKPTDFNFSRDKKFSPNLPTELFNKLSLKSEVQPSYASQVFMAPAKLFALFQVNFRHELEQKKT